MCIRPDYTRRYCLKCKRITHWQLDRKIGHSRCIVCHSDSRKAKKIVKNVYEEPKMNKQYVQEQIKIAIGELRAEYDEIVGNIYQCPDCGALAFRNSEHICLGKRLAPVAIPEGKRDLLSYVLDALPTEPPADMLEADSPYLSLGIGKRIVELGFTGKPASVSSNLAKLFADSGGRIKRVPVAIREKGISKKKLEFEKIVTGFAYWRSA